MAFLTYKNISVAGISACVPSQIVKNESYELISEEERLQLIKQTGVEEKRIADSETTASDLCERAAVRLIESLKWNKQDIGLLIFLSQSPDYFLPSTSIILQHKLGLSQSCLCFDIRLGCSGYVYALSTAAAYLSSGSITKALILCGDKSSSSVSSYDKSTYPLFGDAGSATGLEYALGAPGINFNLNSDGSGYESIIIPEGAGRNPFNEHSMKLQNISTGISRNGIQLILNGSAVFDFTLNQVLPAIQDSLRHAQCEIGSFNFFVFHQANLLLNETLRKLLKIPAEKMPYSLKKYGNTSSASIPLTIVTQLSRQFQHGTKKVMFCGFGVGLSWGTVILDIGETIIIPDLIEY